MPTDLSYRHSALISIPIVWGAYAPVTKGLLPDNVSAQYFFILSCFSSLLSLLFFLPPLWHIIGRAELSRQDWSACALMGLYLFSGQMCQTVALAFVSASTNAVLTQTSCIIVNRMSLAAEPVSRVDGPRRRVGGHT